MKYFFMVLLTASCASTANNPYPSPDGEKVFSLFLANFDKNLENEPLCKAELKLYEQLALSLSVSYDSENTTSVNSYCAPSKHPIDNQLVDIWDCTIQFNEANQNGEFISSSTYVFGISAEADQFIHGTLRCY